MNSRVHDPFQLDVEAFAKDGATLQGQWPLSRLPRLDESVLRDATGHHEDVSWRVEGERREVRGGPTQTWLHVASGAKVMLECQRCLKPVMAPVAIERSFMFVHGEAAAAELDIDSEDDVLAFSRSLDVAELIEDELLLALPLVPRHEVCPEPLVASTAELPPDDTPHPFAALAALKKGKLPN
ncbi:MAG: hypothetical protein RLZZ618_3373 [Pseudomonadota bacterium]|jgi:uncharacterized protein